jgi:hypothetical protein
MLLIMLSEDGKSRLCIIEEYKHSNMLKASRDRKAMEIDHFVTLTHTDRRLHIE